MQGFKVEDTRTIAVVAHSGAGKTSVIEALLHKSGAMSRMGKVDDGTSVCDYNPEEKERKVTIYAKPVHFSHAGKSMFLMDTPGYADFFGDVISTLRVVDSAIIVVCGESGIQVGTQRVWKKIKESNIPCMIFINKMDKENADFSKVVNSIRNSFGNQCVPICVPEGSGASFKGVKDIISGGDGEYKNMLIESVAESDDSLLEKYLGTGLIDENELKPALKKAILENKVIPIVCGSAVQEAGITELLSAIEYYMPSPQEKGVPKDVCKPDPKAPYAAFVFKTVTDPFVGQVTFFRVYSGTIRADSEIYNAAKASKEKLAQLLVFTGKEQKTTQEAGPGDIIAVTKLKNTKVSDSFSDPSSQIKFDPIVFPKPSVSFAVVPHAKGDEEKIGNGLQRLAEEDHTFEVNRDKETKELVISGMGELHLDIMLDKLKKKFGVFVDKSIPKVAYKETINSKGSAQYRHKKQSGGAGQFAEVWLKVEPMQRGGGFEFADEVVGGAIPQQFVVSCEKGIRKTLETGFLAGYPVVDVRAIVYDGKTHPVDSKDIAFQTAAKKAFKEACLGAKPVLLEPIMNVEIYVPPEFMGDITGDLNGKRGRVMGMEQMGDLQAIKAQVPISEMSKYSADLKSMTSGQGSFSMEFSHYEEVPARLAQDIVAKAAKDKKEEEEE
jgi:elongation factor G